LASSSSCNNMQLKNGFIWCLNRTIADNTSLVLYTQFVYYFMSSLVANKVYRYFWSPCLFGESLKLKSAWDHTVNMKFDVFYSTVTNVFLFLSRFFTFFYIYGAHSTPITILLAAYTSHCFLHEAAICSTQIIFHIVLSSVQPPECWTRRWNVTDEDNDELFSQLYRVGQKNCTRFSLQ